MFLLHSTVYSTVLYTVQFSIVHCRVLDCIVYCTVQYSEQYSRVVQEPGQQQVPGGGDYLTAGSYKGAVLLSMILLQYYKGAVLWYSGLLYC